MATRLYEAVATLKSFLHDIERIGKLIVTSKRQNKDFLLFLSTITNENDSKRTL